MNEYDVSLIIISMIDQMIEAGVLLPGPNWEPTDEGVKERMAQRAAPAGAQSAKEAADAASINEKRSGKNDQE